MQESVRAGKNYLKGFMAAQHRLGDILSLNGNY